MNKNYARDLHELLVKWKKASAASPSHVPAQSVRTPEVGDFWEFQRRAVMLLEQVEIYLNARAQAGLKTKTYESAFQRWHEYVFGIDYEWSSSATNMQMSDSSLDLLEALSHVMDALPPEPPIAEESRESIKSGLEDFQNYLAEDGHGLSQSERQYLLRLQQSIRGALEDHQILGGIDLRSRIAELIGFLEMLARIEDQNNGNPGRFRTMIDKIIPFVKLPTRAAIVALDVATNLKELGS